MVTAGSVLYGFIIELPEKNTLLVGNDNHTWPFEGYDDALLSIQKAGAKILHALHDRVDKRIAMLYNYSAKEEDSGWTHPVPIIPASDFRPGGIVFVDRTFRSHVGEIMHWPGMGVKTANQLLEDYTFMEVTGRTEEGLENAKKLWIAQKGVGKTLVQNWEDYIRA